MPAQLISAGDLIKGSWQAFVKSWDQMVRYSAWLILPAALAILDLAVPGNQEALVMVSVLAQAAVSIAVGMWVSVALFQVAFALDKGEKVSDKTTQNAWQMVLPLLLIGLLQGLATVGALLLLVIPGIYVGVRLGFSQLTLFSKNLRGRAALAESWTLTKDRFWAVLWRQLAGGVVFGLLILLVTTAAVLLVGAVAGGAKLGAMFDQQNASPIVANVLSLVQTIVQAAFIPLFVIFQVKLYKALDKSRA